MAQTVRADIARTTQIGIQSAFGTSVAANLRFPTMHFERGQPEKKSMRAVRPSTYKVPTGVVGGKENSMWTAKSDGITYDEMVYVLETCIKTTAPSSSGAAHTRQIIPAVSSQDTRNLFTLEDGQTGNMWKVQDAFFQGFNLKSSPESVDFSANVMGTELTIPASLTGSPTSIDNKPILVERVGVFNATTFANLVAAPTVLDNALSCELDFNKIINPYFRLRQSERSYSGSVEVAPEMKINLTCAMDQTAQEIKEAQFTLAQWRAGTVTFLRWQAITTDFITGAIAWELTFDMCVMVQEPFKLEVNQELSVVTWPCVIAADSLNNWLTIKSVSKVAAL